VSAAPRAARGRKAVAFEFGGDNATLAHVTGALDENLRQIESGLDVAIRRRGHRFRVEGETTQARRAVLVLEHLLAHARRPVTAEDVQLRFRLDPRRVRLL